MNEPKRKSSVKDWVIIAIGAIIFIALLVVPLILMRLEANRAAAEGKEAWGALAIMIMMILGLGPALPIALVTMILGLTARCKGLGLKWFLLGFDIVGMVYATSLTITLISLERADGINIAIGLSFIAGVATIIILSRARGRLRRQAQKSAEPIAPPINEENPPSS